jgi:hypothetical protein
MTFADQERPLFKNADGKDATEPLDAGQVNLDPVPETADDRKANKDTAGEFLNTVDGDGTRDDLERVADTTPAATPLGDALTAAAAATDLPQLVIADFDAKDWTSGGLIKAMRAAAKTSGWPEAAINTMRDVLFRADGVEAAKDSLRPHVHGARRPFSAIKDEAAIAFPDESKLRALYGEAVANYPAQYPGGNSESGFRAFREDVEELVASRGDQSSEA